MLIPFLPPPGLNSDDTTFSAEGRWADCNNVRFRNGKPEVIGGATTSLRQGGQALSVTGVIVNMHARLRATGATSALTLGTTGATGSTPKLYTATMNSGTLSAATDITPPSLPSDSPSGVAYWSLAAFGDILLAAPSGGKIYASVNLATAEQVTGAPNQNTCILVTPHRQVLALGTNEEVSGTFNARCIRGSDIEDYTDWTTSSSNNAFEHILDGAAAIVAARMVGEYVAVWTDDALYLGTFIGDPGQAYRFDRVARGCGLLSYNTVTVMGSTAYWLGPDLRLRVWSPGGEPQIIPCPIFNEFSSNLSTGNISKAFVFFLPMFTEVWIFYPDNRDLSASTSSTRYIAVNVTDGTWFRGQMERSAALVDGALASYRSGAALVTQFSAIGRAGCITAGNGGGQIIAQEQSPPSFAWSLTSADRSMSGGERRVLIRGVRPDFESQTGDVVLTLFTRDHPQSTAVTKGPYTLTTSTAKKDFRASGKLLSVKFSGAAGTSMRLGKPLFDMVPLGER